MSIPDVTIHGLSGVRCCLTQIHKKSASPGQLEVDYSPNTPPSPCQTGQHAQAPAKITLTLMTEGPTCDQDPHLSLIPDKSQLHASGNIIVRQDGLAHFLGSFAIVDPSGNTRVKGTLEALFRVGTHHPPFIPVPGEACNPERHLEGWLDGSGAGPAPFSNYTLRALMVAQVSVSLPPSPPHTVTGTIAAASINGVVITCS